MKFAPIINLEKFGVAKTVYLVKKLKFNYIEIFLPVSEKKIPEKYLYELTKLTSLPLGFHYKTSTIIADPSRYNFIINQVIDYLDLAEKFGVKNFTIHPATTRRKNLYLQNSKKSEPDWWYKSLEKGVPKDFISARRATNNLLEQINKRKRKTIISLENVDFNNDFYRRPDRLSDIIKLINKRQNIKICFDIYKAFTTEKSIKEAVRSVKEKIAVFHISDISPAKKGHYLIGHGAINWKSFFNTVKESRINAPFILEVPIDELAVSMKYIRSIL